MSEDPVEPPAKPEFFPRVFHGLRSALHWMFSRPWLAALAVAVALYIPFYLQRSIKAPVIGNLFTRVEKSIFPTYGYIYLANPQVYTRERLVNDRYDQDHWLRGQLEWLNEQQDPERWIERQDSARAGVSIGDGPPVGLEDDAVGGPLPKAFQSASVGQEFLLRSALRDKIRQSILENALDDRHDLAGNTVYGLKFDTAIIPGGNTHLNPVVLVSMDVDPFARADDGSRERFDLDEFTPYIFGGSPPVTVQMQRSTEEIFEGVDRQFGSWLENLEGRLNSYRDVCKDVRGGAFRPASGSPVKGIQEAVGYVLGLDANEIEKVDRDEAGKDALWDNGRIKIPPPWNSYFNLQFGEGGNSGDRLGSALSISQFRSSVMALRESSVKDISDYRLDFSIVGRVPPGATDPEQTWRIYDLNVLNSIPEPDSYDTFPKWTPADQVKVRQLTGKSRQTRDFVNGLNNKTAEHFARQAGGHCLVDGRLATLNKQCGIESGNPVEGQIYQVRTGLDAYLQKVYDAEAYAYAVFPRGDVVGVTSDSFAGANAGLDGLNTALSTQARSVGTKAEPHVVNFAAGPNDSYSFDFGWAVVRPGQQTPTQTSQVVLVSVPAYLDKLKLTVRTGWLDPDKAHGFIEDLNALSDFGEDEIGLEAYEGLLGKTLRAYRKTKIEVKLPPDYDALDSLVTANSGRQGPAINDRYLGCATGREAEMQLRAGEPASIVIPGERLWKSTMVTLNGQLADRIQVLPDMRGIIATFEEVASPARSDEEGVSASLLVWTSEGSSPVRTDIQVLPPAPKKQPFEESVDGSARNGQTEAAVSGEEQEQREPEPEAASR